MSALLDSFASAFDALAARDAAGLGDSAPRRARRRAARRPARHAQRSAGSTRRCARSNAARSRPSRCGAGVVRCRAARRHPGAAPGLRQRPLRCRATPTSAGLPHGVSLQPLSQVLAARRARARPTSWPAASSAPTRSSPASTPRSPTKARCCASKPARARTRAVHLVFVGAPARATCAWHLRHLIELRDGAELTLVEHHLAAGAHSHLGNAADARPPRPRARRLTPRARAGRSRRRHRCSRAPMPCWRATPTIAASTSSSAPALSRHELNVALHGEGAQAASPTACCWPTASATSTPAWASTMSRRDTACDLLWRGLGAGRSQGRVPRRHPDPRRRRRQRRRAVEQEPAAVSEGAEIDTQPVLEIHADEVQAAHGATVGQLDATALFYLRTPRHAGRRRRAPC